jgi:hypothetical protein
MIPIAQGACSSSCGPLWQHCRNGHAFFTKLGPLWLLITLAAVFIFRGFSSIHINRFSWHTLIWRINPYYHRLLQKKCSGSHCHAYDCKTTQCFKIKFWQYLIPDYLIMDNCWHFKDALFSKSAKILNFQYRPMTRLWPQANMEAEQQNCFVLKAMKTAWVTGTGESKWQDMKLLIIQQFRALQKQCWQSRCLGVLSGQKFQIWDGHPFIIQIKFSEE